VGCVNSVSPANPRFLERGPGLRTPHVVEHPSEVAGAARRRARGGGACSRCARRKSAAFLMHPLLRQSGFEKSAGFTQASMRPLPETGSHCGAPARSRCPYGCPAERKRSAPDKNRTCARGLGNRVSPHASPLKHCACHPRADYETLPRPCGATAAPLRRVRRLLPRRPSRRPRRSRCSRPQVTLSDDSVCDGDRHAGADATDQPAHDGVAEAHAAVRGGGAEDAADVRQPV
jgi:hypothetical protein